MFLKICLVYKKWAKYKSRNNLWVKIEKEPKDKVKEPDLTPANVQNNKKKPE